MTSFKLEGHHITWRRQGLENSRNIYKIRRWGIWKHTKVIYENWTIDTRSRKNLRPNSQNCVNRDFKSSRTGKSGRRNKFFKNRFGTKSAYTPCECKRKLNERTKLDSNTGLRLRKERLLIYMLNGRAWSRRRTGLLSDENCSLFWRSSRISNNT